MKKTIYIVLSLLVVMAIVLLVWLSREDRVVPLTQEEIKEILSLPDSPQNATYRVLEHEHKLVDGEALTDAGTLRVTGEPYYGDLNGDGYDDAVVLLSYEDGATSYFIGVALQDERGFMGLETIPLDRGLPMSVVIRNEYIALSYTSEQMELSSTVYEYYIVSGVVFRKVSVLREDDEVFTGWYSFSDESMSFTSCAGDEYSIVSTSPSYAALKAIYREREREEKVQGGVFVVFSGYLEEGVLAIQTIVTVPEQGACDVQMVPDTSLEEEEMADHTSPQ